MTPNSPQALAVKATIDRLIQTATGQEYHILETIYHDSMRIYMLDGQNITLLKQMNVMDMC